MPYGRRLKADIAELKAFGVGLVEEGRDRLSREEHGEKDSDAGNTGMLLRELIKEHPKDDDVPFLADSCLNFLTAGKQAVRRSPSGIFI